MRKYFGSDPRNLIAAIGRACKAAATTGRRSAYEIRDAVRLRQQFVSRGQGIGSVREKYPLLFLTARAPGHSELPARLFLDLVKRTGGNWWMRACWRKISMRRRLVRHAIPSNCSASARRRRDRKNDAVAGIRAEVLTPCRTAILPPLP